MIYNFLDKFYTNTIIYIVQIKLAVLTLFGCFSPDFPQTSIASADQFFSNFNCQALISRKHYKHFSHGSKKLERTKMIWVYQTLTIANLKY